MLQLTVFLLIVGLIVIFLGIFSFRSAVYRNESRTPFVFLIILGLILAIYGGFSAPKYAHSQVESQRQPSKKAETSASHMTAHSRNLVFDGGAAKRKAATQRLNEQSVRKQLSKSYQSLGKLTFNRQTKTFQLVITDHGYNKAMTYLKKHPKQAKQVKWPDSVASFKKTSLSIKKSLGPGYRLMVRASIPKLTTLLTIKDGKVTQNFVG